MLQVPGRRTLTLSPNPNPNPSLNPNPNPNPNPKPNTSPDPEPNPNAVLQVDIGALKKQQVRCSQCVLARLRLCGQVCSACL